MLSLVVCVLCFNVSIIEDRGKCVACFVDVACERRLLESSIPGH